MAIALVTGQVAVAEANAAAATAVLPNNPTAGNFVGILFGSAAASATITSIKDSASTPNNYTATSKSPSGGTVGGNHTIGIAYLKNVPSGATKSITVTLSGVASLMDVWAAEFSGVDPTSPFENDATGSSSTAGTNINLPSYTTLNAGDLLLGTCFLSGSASAANSPWTEISTIPASGNGAEYTIKATAGAQAVGWTASSSTWSAIIAAFKAAPTIIPVRRPRLVYARR